MQLVTLNPVAAPRLPKWLKKNLPSGGGLQFTSRLIDDLKLETVCESAKCPNRLECCIAKDGHLHDSRQCLHPAVRVLFRQQGSAEALEDDEPDRVAEAAARSG